MEKGIQEYRDTGIPRDIGNQDTRIKGYKDT